MIINEDMLYKKRAFLFFVLLFLGWLFFKASQTRAQVVDLIPPTTHVLVTCSGGSTQDITSTSPPTVQCSTTSATIQVNCIDDPGGQGCQRTTYTIDGTISTITSWPGPITTITNASSTHTVTNISSTDNALNVETTWGPINISFNYGISGQVFVDNNPENGIWDAGEVAYASAYTVIAQLTTGGPTYSCTNCTGTYSIGSLSPGTYNATLTVPTGYHATTANPIANITLPPSATNQNFGIAPNVISGTVYLDPNGTCTGTTTYTGAFSVSTTPASTTPTYASGTYTFSYTPANTYSVTLASVAGYDIINCNGAVNGTYSGQTVPPSKTNLNFYIRQRWKIYGRVFEDIYGPPNTFINSAKEGAEPYKSGVTLTLSGGTSATTTTDVNGYYEFLNLPAGSNYTVTITDPAGYTSNYTSNPNSRTVIGLSADTGFNFAITKLYTVSGEVYLDDDKNQVKSPGETTYGGPIVINRTDPAPSSPLTQTATVGGTYTVSNMIGGVYSISYAGPPVPYKLTYPKPAQYNPVTMGVGCVPKPFSPNQTSGNPPQPLDGTCDPATGNISKLNFGITNSFPWFQACGQDVRFDGGVADPIPTGTLCGRYAVNDSGICGTTDNSVVYTGDTTPDFGQGSASPNNWVVAHDPSVPATAPPFSPVNAGVVRTSYQYMLTTIKQSGLPTQSLLAACGGSLNNCTLNANLASGIYQADGDVTLSASPYIFPCGRNFVILINGTLTINASITVPDSSTATFSVAKDIVIASSVGQATTACITAPTPTPIGAPTPTPGSSGCPAGGGVGPSDICTSPAGSQCVLQGVFSADNNVILQGTNNCTAGPDKQICVKGSLAPNAALKGGGFQNLRDLCKNNLLYPAIVFIANTCYNLLAPDFVKHQNFVWQEVAP